MAALSHAFIESTYASSFDGAADISIIAAIRVCHTCCAAEGQPHIRRSAPCGTTWSLSPTVIHFKK
jgi:hypothetical protein